MKQQRYGDISVEMHGHVAVIELRRPPHNFFDLALIRSLAESYEAMIAAFGTGQVNASRAHLLYVAPGRVVAASARLMPVARSGPDDFVILLMLGDSRVAPPDVTSR